MTGPTGLTDTLLASKLSQRLDLLGLRSAAEVARPHPAAAVQPAVNEVRLPSRATLERQLPQQPAPAPLPKPAGAAPTSAQTHWSSAGQAIATVLADPEAPSRPVRAPAALLPTAVPLSVAALAERLAQAVSGSGLFYESHLQALASGSRTLQQLRNQPQAGLHRDPAVQPLASGRGAGGQETEAVAGVIHPRAVLLVHQQLDLLGTGIFRLEGELWPGMPLQWTVQEAGAEAPPEATEEGTREVSPRSWSTRMTLDLPHLGPLELGLVLSGSRVWVRVIAAEAMARERLQDSVPALDARLAQEQLQLEAMQLGEEAPP